MLKSEIKEVREILRTEDGVEFTVNGITEYGKKEDGSYGQVKKVFKARQGYKRNYNTSIGTQFDSMNVTKWGPTCVTLYTYDMLGKRSVGKIRYADVRFVVSEEELHVLDQLETNPLKNLDGFIGTENCPV